MKKDMKLSNSEISSFCGQMAMILKSGITPKDGLTILLSDTDDEATRILLQKLLNYISLGETFTSSIKNSGVFPDYVVNMISIGEETGKMDEVMQSLTEYYEHEESVIENLRGAVTYPFVMIFMMLIIIVIIITKVLPLFNQVFIQLGTELDGFSGSLLKIGETMQSYSIVFLAILVLLALFSIYIFKTKLGRVLLHKMIIKIAPLKSFSDSVAYGRFASGMSLMIGSGMGIFQSLEMVSHIVDAPDIARRIINCQNHITAGDNFAEALEREHFFTNLYLRMISLAAKTGNIDSTLKTISLMYEEENDKKIRSFISILEPTLVISLSLIVGLILLSVILPLLSIMTSIG